MAHARKITPTSTVETETEDNMTCAICHEVYKAPKLLECTHTFCQDCLGGFVGEASKFHCPMCRREIRVPPGGVSAFRSNPYIRSQDLDKARKTFLCREHAKKELELYCLDCDLPVCVLCMMKGHVHHHMKTISEAAADVQDQLQTDRVRLQHAVDDVTKHVAEAEGRLKALQEKKISVEKEIRCKHASLVAAADKLRDEALRALKDVSGEIEQRLTSDCQQIEENLNHLKKLHNTVGKTLTEGVDYERATVAKEMRCGEGKAEAVQGKVSCRISTITRPVLRCGETDDSKVLKKMGEFVGEVVRLERRESMVVGKKSRASVVGRIGQQNGDDCEELTFYCHRDSDLLSFESSGNTAGVPRRVVFFYPNWKDCSTYWRCSNHTASKLSCPPGQTFDFLYFKCRPRPEQQVFLANTVWSCELFLQGQHATRQSSSPRASSSNEVL